MNLPIGAIIAWHKNLTGTPALPAGWVECNGGTLDNPDSPLHGQSIPNLNGDKRFLRGGSASGDLQQDAMQAMKGGLSIVNGAPRMGINDVSGWTNPFYGEGSSGYRAQVNSNSGSFAKIIFDNSRAARTADETRPINMSVVWIMKVADVGGSTAVDQVTDLLAAEDWNMAVVDPDPAPPFPDEGVAVFAASWANNDSLNPLRYRKLTTGAVELRGEIVAGDGNATFLLLPTAYYPGSGRVISASAKCQRYLAGDWIDTEVEIDISSPGYGFMKFNSATIESGLRIRFYGFTYTV